LRKGSSSLRLPLAAANVPYGNVEFVGWVTPGYR